MRWSRISSLFLVMSSTVLFLSSFLITYNLALAPFGGVTEVLPVARLTTNKLCVPVNFVVGL